MNYTVVTYVTQSHHPPPPGQDVAVGVREYGCFKCIDHYDKLTLCIDHRRLIKQVLWSRTETIVEVEDNVTETVSVEADGPLPTGVLPTLPELVEVPA